VCDFDVVFQKITTTTITLARKKYFCVAISSSVRNKTQTQKIVLCLRYPYIKLFLKIVHFGPNTKNSVSFYLFIGLSHPDQKKENLRQKSIHT